MGKEDRIKALKVLNEGGAKILNNPNSFTKKLFKNKKKVTVVTASYNAEKSIEKTIESVIKQSHGFDQIQYIIVDDCSTDKTPEIVTNYAKKYKNICFVSLNTNSGSPGLPRNIGIELAETPYITFLDADDWLHPQGIESLYNILEETGDGYVVGKTIKVETKGESVIGEFASVKERRSISPFDVPHFFYHMGPTARMMKTSIIKEHVIRFPEMKFAEDKLFFIEVFLNAGTVSTTTAPIYFANRLEDNSSSLTRTTHVLDKRRADLKAIQHVQSLEIPEMELKTILNRIYEYDFMRTFDSILFVNANNKQPFLDILSEAVSTTTGLNYNFVEEFKNPFYKYAVNFFLEGEIDTFIRLFEWYKKQEGKKHVIIEGKPYYEVPFIKGEKKFAPISMLANALDSYIEGDNYIQTFEVYGDHIQQIESIVIRDRTSVYNEVICPVHIQGNKGTFRVEYQKLEQLDSSLFTVFVRYNEYQLLNIKRIATLKVKKQNRTYDFYTSKANNLSLSIK